MSEEKNDGQAAATTAIQLKPAINSRRRRRWPLIIIGLIFGLLVLGSASFVGATVLEEHDSFCAVCHTVPESTYVDRANTVIANTSATVPDLATVHYLQAVQKNQSFACIDCHRGDSSLSGRAQTIGLGAHDVVVFLSGKGDPTIEKTQITRPDLVNAACIGCHTATLLTVKGTPSHEHNFLPATAALVASGSQLITSGNGGGRFRRVRTIDTTVTCTSCHLAHKTVDNGTTTMYVDKTTAQAACDECHKAAGERPQNFDRLLRGEE